MERRRPGTAPGGRRALTRTCADAAVGQVRRDGDPPALVDTHALQAAIHPGDESPQAHLADEGLASVMAAVTRGQSAQLTFLKW